MTTPEQALVALQTLLQSQLSGTFKTVARKMVFWEKANEQPALFIQHSSSEDHWTDDSLRRTFVTVKAWIYQKFGADDIPSTILNGLVAALDAALAPDSLDTEQLTLGGLVSWCRIEGESEFFPGDTGSQAVAIVSIRMLLTT